MEQPKLERMLRLMKLMTANVNYTVNDLAERLGTTYRSIYRYIDTFKDAGFVVQKLEGGIYKLGKESRYFKDISQLVHFTDEEAHIVNQLIEGLDDTNTLKQNLRRKLTSVYNCTSMATSIVKGRNATNVNMLLEAMEMRRQVKLRDYASSHTGVVRDRVVEPFGFTTNYVQLWCYEPESGMNKLFKISRIGAVVMLDEEWQHADNHAEGYIDIFRMTGFEQHRVQLRLGLLARNLLIEEYPLAERDITPLDDGCWLLDTKVCNFVGIGRFVMGLAEDIEVLTPAFDAYIKETLERIYSRYK
ncbi:MAG: WYL domain-containing protein [Alistipes sp.]|nr:WYL domain-containing protein [Alistipes sp.]MBO5895480.1 WYL domain-containing protein [Alistipes sp.]